MVGLRSCAAASVAAVYDRRPVLKVGTLRCGVLKVAAPQVPLCLCFFVVQQTY